MRVIPKCYPGGVRAVKDVTPATAHPRGAAA